MNAQEEYVLDCDEEGHWYVLPASKAKEASAYFEAAYRFWDQALYEHGDEEPERPEWLVRVNGPISSVRFTGFTIER